MHVSCDNRCHLTHIDWLTKKSVTLHSAGNLHLNWEEHTYMECIYFVSFSILLLFFLHSLCSFA